MVAKDAASPRRTSPRHRAPSQSQEEPPADASTPSNRTDATTFRWTSPRLRKKRSQSHDVTTTSDPPSRRGRPRSKSDAAFELRRNTANKGKTDDDQGNMTTPTPGRQRQKRDAGASLQKTDIAVTEVDAAPETHDSAMGQSKAGEKSNDTKCKPSQSSHAGVQENGGKDEEEAKRSAAAADDDNSDPSKGAAETTNGSSEKSNPKAAEATSMSEEQQEIKEPEHDTGTSSNATEGNKLHDLVESENDHEPKDNACNLKKLSFHEDRNSSNKSQETAAAASKLNNRKRRKRSRKNVDASPRNELTSVIPGYTAALQLDTSSLNVQRPGLEELRRRALITDKTTAAFVMGTLANQNQTNGMLASKPTAAASASFKMGAKRMAQNHAGSGWFGMIPTPMTDDLKRDLTVIRSRNYLDPKRFYKSSDRPSQFLQVGTVVEGTGEFFSSRLSKKQRRSNLTEEIMADPAAAEYTKKKYKQMQQAKGAKSREQQKWTKGRRKGKRAHL